VGNQAYIFILSVFGGMLLVFIYDIFRIKRKAFKTNNLVTYLEDILYWIIAAGVMFGIVYFSNDGEIRGFLFLGIFLGAVIYMLLLSKVIMTIALKCIEILGKVFRIIWKIAIYPFNILFKIILIPAKFIKKIVLKLCRNTRRIGRIRKVKMSFEKKIFRNARKKI